MRATFASGNTRFLLTVLIAVGAHGSPLAGQSARNEYEVAAGAVFPKGQLGRDLGAGPVFRVSIQRRDPAKDIQFRLEAETWRMSSSALDGYGGLRAFSVAYDVMAGPTAAGIAPYALVGAGTQLVVNQNPDGYPGVLAIVRLGVGLRGSVGRNRLSLEIAGAGAVRNVFEYAYWPMTLGLTF